MKLSLYGPSGSGKSTISRLFADHLRQLGWTVEVVKLGLPLYRTQAHMYALAGREIGEWEPDQELLRTLATQFRRINPAFLVDDFLARVQASPATAVINDDLRDAETDYPSMHAAGFRFVEIQCAEHVRARRLAARPDRSQAPETKATWGYDRLIPNWTIDNSSDDPQALRLQVHEIVSKSLAERTEV